MNFKIVQGYVLAGLSALVLLAAVLLMILNGGVYGKFSLFGRQPVDVNVGLLLLFSAIGGIVLMYTVRLLIFGIRSLAMGRREQAAKQPPPSEQSDSSGNP
jgi:uncharacterized membrane protein